MVGMTDPTHADDTPADSSERFKNLPPAVPIASVVAYWAVDEFPFGGPEGGGDGADGD